ALSTASSRERLLLDFNWRFQLGNAADLQRDFNYGKLAREGTFAKAGRAGAVTYVNFDDSAWRKIDLPHDWAVELPFQSTPALISEHGAKPLGRDFPDSSIGWYRRTIPFDPTDAGKRISIEFDGVFRQADVFFNGFYLGTNFSGYAPFRFEVTDFTTPGQKNVLTLRVDASMSESWYYEGAGIYRHVWLVKTSPVHMASWSHCVRSELTGKYAAISVLADVLNETDKPQQCTLRSSILSPAGKVVATARSESIHIAPFGRHSFVARTQVIDPQLWSTESIPAGQPLYRAVTRVHAGNSVVDDEETNFGIRSLRWDANKGFFLNGTAVKIKGTCNHQDHAGVGSALPDRLQHYRIERLREFGSNAYRTTHNPPTPELLDACDELGMMVMCETRMFSSSPEGLSELERMVMRFRNHPSVILWSIGNEEPEQGPLHGEKIASSMRQRVRELDPTRLVTLPMNGSWGQGASYGVDVQGFNYFQGDMEAFRRKFPNQPCVFSEIGSVHCTRGIYQNDEARGYFSAYDENHASYSSTAEAWWKYTLARPWLAGGFVWAGFDYRGESKHPWPTISSHSGIFDTCGFPKDNYYYYRAWWGKEPVLHLFPHWNWNGKEGQEIDVWCHSNLDSVELFLNGKSLGSKSVEQNSHVSWKVRYTPGVIEARGQKAGGVSLTSKRETTFAPARIRMQADRTTIAANSEDLAVITIEVVDAAGRIVPTASNMIRFLLSGPGKLLGLGNGDPSCDELDKAEQRSAFNGLCMALVQSNRTPGPITFQASSPGLESASIVIQGESTASRAYVK
ncbi:MAG TPA: beta-galactosidase GalA, partial [Acidobacteriaceae bacterium]|nr:beta-galactosidase GalA [Acidobacteriaceae bacterium]